jgi:hypothetical protein
MASHAMSVSRFTLLLSACDNRAGKRSGRAHDQYTVVKMHIMCCCYVHLFKGQLPSAASAHCCFTAGQDRC